VLRLVLLAACLSPTSAAADPSPAQTSTATDQAATGDPLSTGLPQAELPKSGPNSFVFAPASRHAIGKQPPTKTYSVGVEKGLDIDPVALAEFVDATFSDPRSWVGTGRYGFRRVASRADIKIVIATAQTVDKICKPLTTVGIYSCARNRYIAINLERWETAVEHWTASLELYRRYVVNHEMGHYLGQRHEDCPGDGQRAPLMMQQTKSLEACLPNGWPFPARAERGR